MIIQIFIVLLILLFLAMIVSLVWRVKKATGVFGIVTNNKGVYGLVDKMVSLSYAAVLLNALLYAFDSEEYDLFIQVLLIPTWVQGVGLVLTAIFLCIMYKAQLQMGDSWRIGVDTKNKTELVSTGLFRYFRHPIYFFALLTVASIILVIPSMASVLIFFFLYLMLNIQSQLEEEHMFSLHGETYVQYLKEHPFRFMKLWLIIAVGLLVLWVWAASLVKEEFVATDPQVLSLDRPATLAEKSVPFEVIAVELAIPWDVAELFPSGDLLVTERGGDLVRISDGLARTVATVDVGAEGEGGLLGMAVRNDRDVYLYHTYEESGRAWNRVVRYVLDDGLKDPVVIIDRIPAAKFHNGGRIEIGPDDNLYITTGDAGVPSLSQDLDSLAGKLLRITLDGGIPEDNPFPGSPVYSYGHRNAQGLAWDDAGVLWSSEHGRSFPRSGLDEINRIVPGGNYGWPESQGDKVVAGTIGPVLHSGSDTWAPGSLAFYNGRLYFGGLKGSALYEFDHTAAQPTLRKVTSDFGRIRTVRVLNGALVFTTSNRDGRGKVREGDDRIVWWRKL